MDVRSLCRQIYARYATFLLPYLHYFRADDGTCDICGKVREVGMLRWHVDSWRDRLFPKIERLCYDCMIVAEGWDQ